MLKIASNTRTRLRRTRSFRMKVWTVLALLVVALALCLRMRHAVATEEVDDFDDETLQDDNFDEEA